MSTPRHVWAKLLLLALVCYFLIPVWWLVVASTKDAQGLFAGSGALWFRGFHLGGNVKDLFTYNNGEYLRWLGNSALYAVTGGVGATVISVLAGYGFAKFGFRGRNALFALVLGSVTPDFTPNIYAFNLAFTYAQFNYASTISFSLGFVVFLAVGVFMFATRKRGSLFT